jgi:hypothetical protein
LYFKNIESIAASEGSYVSSANFKQTIMDLNAREGAEIKIDLMLKSKRKSSNWRNN